MTLTKKKKKENQRGITERQHEIFQKCRRFTPAWQPVQNCATVVLQTRWRIQQRYSDLAPLSWNLSPCYPAAKMEARRRYVAQ